MAELPINTAEVVSREHEKQVLRAERETERAGGAPLPSVPINDTANLRPELLEQLAHVRQTLREELSAVGPDEACLTCSFQAEDVLLLHLAMELRPDIPVLFLDTGYHFKETYEYRDRIATDWHLNLTNLLPRQTVPQQESEFGLLYQTEPNRCCGFRKVEPLFDAVAQYKVWLTGLRREQARSRTALKEIDDFAVKPGIIVRKLSPFADWTTRDVWQLCAHFNIPLLPLYDLGYTSIGCEPCTTLPTDPNDPRSGRWAGKKVECGIHIQATEDGNPDASH
ncbi:phosphoadenylyl-sulfate reductase [Terriglobus roseus]|uniref:Adenosine 5'-phosphosulfate reductase n=1 Tax=Terriglobus roseus TaxID=392734 RepID=A0A1H4SVK4_9BACT|nr:phosphoadenylyl-sulfate reductase [Terriglobus roseus]SEC48060.1 phosphoadenylylsulfate reductase (thioredoxin) [Terriglobus roseus]